VALCAVCWLQHLLAQLKRRADEGQINEDDEVVLELDLSNLDSSVVKPKRNLPTASPMHRTVLLCAVAVAGFGGLVVAAYAQLIVIPDAESMWAVMSLSSGVLKDFHYKPASLSFVVALADCCP
jgi:hypothetical protein